jgi:ElaB/YqjD/DUF883 family membrane-anchored ribosome-binding protein
MMKNVDLKTKVADKLEEAAVAIREYDLESKYKETVEPVEKKIREHPIPSVLVAVGAGIVIGALACKICKARLDCCRGE